MSKALSTPVVIIPKAANHQTCNANQSEIRPEYIKVANNAMMPELQPGDEVLVVPCRSEDLYPGQLVAVEYEQSLILGCVYRENSTMWIRTNYHRLLVDNYHDFRAAVMVNRMVPRVLNWHPSSEYHD